MPRSATSPVLAAVIVFLATSVSRDSSDAVCSFSPLPLGRDPHATYFVGRALADTVLAGVGAVEPSKWGAEQQPKREAVYGQGVRVAQLGGLGADQLEQDFARSGSREVVAVPWGYDPGCQPAYWTESARWVAVGSDGFFRARLRPDSLWATGHPTLDVFFAADLEPYDRDHRTGEPSNELTPAQYFSLYAALPARSGRGDRDWAALVAAVRRWTNEHPGTSDMYPVRQLLEFAREALLTGERPPP